ncbi:MAG: hypothetical protein LCH34_04335 [Firmicutes bacterium]|nr:hypothetical protein [Bacillota bacterium]
MNHSTWCHIILENLQSINPHLAHHDRPFEPDWISLNTPKSEALDTSYEWIHYTISCLPEPMAIDYTYDYMMTSM